MSKPEDISQEAWSVAQQITADYCGCAPGRSRLNGTSHSDSCWDQTERFARAILAAKAEEREACAELAELVGIPMAANGSEILMIPVRIADRIRKRGEC